MMATTTDVASVRSEMKELFGQVPSWVAEMPDVTLGGFWTLMRDFQLGETAIPNKYKELIGLAVSGATRCRYCALFHTEAARLFGASDQEIAEASMMAGFTMMASTFLNAQQVDYDAFRKETLEIVQYVRTHPETTARSQPTQAAGHA
jgi:AhpD family alkylhydroperoxidase